MSESAEDRARAIAGSEAWLTMACGEWVPDEDALAALITDAIRAAERAAYERAAEVAKGKRHPEEIYMSEFRDGYNDACEDIEAAILALAEPEPDRKP